ncbi:MAG: ferritin family protein [Candidatus Glassbacteria bacterium]
MSKSEVLEILSLAIQAEVSAYVFYQRAVEKVNDDEIKNTLIDLARDEKDHFKVLESQYDSLHRSERWITYKDALLAEDLPDINERITESHKDMLDKLDEKKTTLEVLEMGLEKENRAYNFYKSQIENVSSTEGRDTFEHLMNFELGHVRKIENMIKRIG